MAKGPSRACAIVSERRPIEIESLLSDGLAPFITIIIFITTITLHIHSTEYEQQLRVFRDVVVRGYGVCV